MNGRLTLMLATLVTLPVLAEPASPRKLAYIDQYDHDLDDRVSSVEFENARRSRFDITDSNRDGVVSADEYVYEWEDRLDAQLARDRAEQLGQVGARHRSLDDDEDGLISRAEFDASGDYSFNRYDSNGDGVIDAGDADPAAPARNREASREQLVRDEQRMLQMPSTHSRAGTIEQYDSDGDETVTRAEFDAGRAEQFAAMDADADGAVSVDEYTMEFEDRVDAAIASFRKRSVDQAYVRFGSLDGDEDGRMTFAEYRVSGHRMFTRWDTDGSGYVTLDEPEPRADAGQDVARIDQSAHPGSAQ